MDKPTQFRSALNGFNRDDVVRYLEYINSRHSAEVAQLNSELNYLRGGSTGNAEQEQTVRDLRSRLKAAEEENRSLRETRPADGDSEAYDGLRAELDAAKAELADLLARQSAEQGDAEECARLREQLTQSEAENAALRKRLDALEENLRQTGDALAAAKAAPMGAELETYRRAERVERVTRERARQITDRLDASLSDAASKAASASENLADIAGQMASQMDLLRAAIGGSQKAFQDSAASVEAIRTQLQDERD